MLAKSSRADAFAEKRMDACARSHALQRARSSKDQAHKPRLIARGKLSRPIALLAALMVVAIQIRYHKLFDSIKSDEIHPNPDFISSSSHVTTVEELKHGMGPFEFLNRYSHRFRIEFQRRALIGRP